MHTSLFSIKSALPLFVLMVSLPVLAQEHVGTVTGTVRDEGGGVLPGVEVTLTNLGTGAQRDVVTNDVGLYGFNSVPIGEYALQASLTGFRTLEQTGIRVVSGEIVTLDVGLTVGQVTETVEVAATLPTIEKQSNKAGYARVNEEIARLPLVVSFNNRQALSFLRTMPGVSYDPFRYFDNENVAMSRSFVQGTPTASPSYNIDGVRASGSTHENARDDTAPIPEMVQEFRLDTNTQAEHGWDSGVAINLVFKSGTNDFHGTGFWYNRNDVFDARPWFAARRAVTRQNDFGFVLGGPIWKNRTFFFGGIDIYKLRTAPSGTTATVPTTAMRSGDFSEILGDQIGTDALGRPVFQGQIFDPASTRPDGQGGFIRNPFPGNVIPSDRSSSITQALLSHIGAPNRPGVSNNWVGTQTLRPDDKESYYLKIDHQIDEAGSHKFTFGTEQNVRLNRSTYPQVFDEAISSLHINESAQYRYRFNYYWTIRPNVILNLRTGVTRTPRIIGTQGLDNDRFGEEIGITGVSNPNAPRVNTEGMTGYGPIFRKLNDPSQTVPAHFDMTWVRGSHNFKFGGSYLLSVSKGDSSIFGQGNFSFQDRTTGLPGFPATGWGFASQFLGEVDGGTVNSPTAFKRDGGAWGFYFQDSWRATPKLTVNYGIRNDVFITAGESYDRIGAFNPTVPNPGAGGLPGALWFWGEGPGRNGFKRVAPTLWSNWGPRLGLAYSPDEKTVLKASAAYMYFPHFGAMTSGFNTPAIGWILNVTAASLDGGVTPGFNWDDGFPDILPNLPDLDPSFANGQSVVALNRDTMKAGRTLTVNFGVERDLGWGTAFRANYHGKFSHSLPSNDAVRLNQLDPRHLALGTLLFADINSPAAAAAGITAPYEGFTGPVNQALRPFPHMLNINERAAPVTDLTYHGVVLSMQKRYGHGMSFMLNYTISKALGNARWANQGHSLASHIQHTSQRHLRYLYDQDRPQNVAVSWMWELPFGPGKRWGADTSSVVKKLIGGWNIGMQQAYFSAQPLHMSSRVRYPGGFNAIWPDRVDGVSVRTGVGCGDYDPNDPSRNRYININAFANPAPFTLGNTRTLPTTRACSYFNENATIQKDTYVNEDIYVRLGADFFNLFNRHIWGNPNTDIGNKAAFGTIRSVSFPPRIIQLSLSIHF